ncbi:MAG: hypothetical protein ACI8RD_014212, partial [Bacillariaceae sp.]
VGLLIYFVVVVVVIIVIVVVELIVAQIDATKAPITANVTIAAAGIEAADKSKCFIANTYASVGDFESVSTTRVFLVCSSILSALVTH